MKKDIKYGRKIIIEQIIDMYVMMGSISDDEEAKRQLYSDLYYLSDTELIKELGYIFKIRGF